MSRKKRLKAVLDKELYIKAKAMSESEGFIYDKHITFFIKYYEIMAEDAYGDYAEAMKPSKS